MTDNAPAESTLPPAAAAASNAAVRSALKETNAAQATANGKEELEDGEIAQDNKPTSTSTGDEQVTVFNDAENFNVVHPLYSTW